MEPVEILKAAIGLFSALAGVALYKLNNTKMLKTRAELVEQFQQALANENKYSVTEMFRLLHGLRMTYYDIETLCADSDVSHIIFALQKTPGMVKYENSSFQYTPVFQKPWIRKINRIFSYGAVWFLGLATLISLIAFVFVKDQAAVVAIFILIPGLTFLTLQLRDIKYDNLVERLVQRGP